MKNKIELKKAIIISLVVIIIIVVGVAISNFYQYRNYTKNFNHAIDKMIAQVVKEYPKVDKLQIIEILNSQTESKNLLREYGIDLEKNSIVLENEELFLKYLIRNVGVIIILSAVLMAIFLKYNSSKDKKLLEITRYIEEINNRNYKLDIEDNTEDELSILKNELYKTTIMLKEIAQNSLNDKISLKDSLSDISHQLKTPLTSINIMLDNILDNQEMDATTRNEFIKDIKREITNINFLINNLLKLSKFDSNTIKFVNREETVCQILEEASKNVAGLCDLKNVEIQITGDSKAKIVCDFKWQVEAITNILKNCVEHSKKNSKIAVYYEQNKMYTKVEIQDNGVGIEKEDLPHIFERFYKGKNASNESIGIGLALAKSIIEKNNGYIGVKSVQNEGSIFTIKYFSLLTPSSFLL